MARCKAITNSGEQCKKEALENGYCSLPAHQALAEQPVEKQDEELCGHVNVHADPPLKCTLPKGHKGDHSTTHYTKDYHRGRVIFEGERETFWNDMAGTPVEEIEPVETEKIPSSPSGLKSFIKRLKQDAEQV